ncbi:MAG: hypothetical protein ACW99J_18720 [Candidatus Thorarchaeota archaeon]|jgi:hypothetical protein
MIDNAQIQTDVVAAIKAESTITSLLHSSAEVREANFMGADFRYPTIRVRIDNHSPINNIDPCDHSVVSFSILCYTEEASSLTCQQLAAAVNDFLHRKHFTGTGYVIRRIRSAGLSGAGAVGQNIWMVNCAFAGTVRPTTAS